MNEADVETIKRRFHTLQLLRVAGFALVILGLVVWRTDKLVPPNELAGKILFLAGAFAMLIMPIVLARSWRRRR